MMHNAFKEIPLLLLVFMTKLRQSKNTSFCTTALASSKDIAKILKLTMLHMVYKYVSPFCLRIKNGV